VSVSISEAREVDLELVTAFGRLIPQLSSSAPPPTADDLAEMIAHDGTTVFVARSDDDSRIVGTLTLVVFRIPTGVRARVEDVVVDESARGQRVGELLTRAAIDKAAAAGCKTVDLTSRRSRESAHRLYERMGFEIRETSVYRMELEAG
jgi:ribosomal protein S18 acetylase RimI-like enzyme